MKRVVVRGIRTMVPMLVLAAAATGWAADKAVGPAPLYTGEWVVISDAIIKELTPADAKPGSFDKDTAGIAVDRTNGDVYMMANNRGICKSTDKGATFALVSGKNVTGRFETGWGINVDPEGKRLMCFSIYGSAAYSDDAGKTWTKSKKGHLDFGAVDWGDTGKALLAIGHESGGTLMLSVDAGKEWKTLGKNFSATGIFDPKTLLTSGKDGGIDRSTDGGEKWENVSKEKLSAPVMVEFKKVGYWLGEGGLLTSKDKGATWTVAVPLPKGACLGPMFGKDETHMVVGAPDGLYESKDAGKTWAFAVPLAPAIKINKRGWFGNYGWDPINNIFYASNMSKPAYKYVGTVK